MVKQSCQIMYGLFFYVIKVKTNYISRTFTKTEIYMLENFTFLLSGLVILIFFFSEKKSY